DDPGPPNPAPKVSVIVAGKDEEDNIEACLRSLAEQDYPNFEIIVCDDRSADGTGAIIDRLAEGDKRIRAVHIDHLPDGWKGKNHALQQGSDLATGEYFFFTDADCRHISPRSLSVAMQLLLDRKAGLLSVLPTLEMKGFWENVVQPVCSGVMMIWFDPNRVNRPESSTANANGAFVLLPRDVYDKIGRHAAIKNILQEDLALAHLVKQKKLGLLVARSSGLYVV
ncbi:MAG: glycosyltransferase, partial [Candidatus Hydrogenedentes bacterium]|nr:glycosyltransferase [Candidatus Hydrogenedentota bacterium]